MIVGITGKKGNGKDTLGNYFVKLGYIRLAFARTLKEACKNIFGFDDDQVDGDRKEVVDEYWGYTPRYALQTVGTELFRNHFDKDIWLKSLKRKILKELEKNPEANFVITDVRFDNEANMIKELGGTMIRVTRKSANTRVDLHESETLIEKLPVDYDLTNDGTIEELFEQVKQIKFCVKS